MQNTASNPAKIMSAGARLMLHKGYWYNRTSREGCFCILAALTTDLEGGQDGY